VKVVSMPNSSAKAARNGNARSNEQHRQAGRDEEDLRDGVEAEPVGESLQHRFLLHEDRVQDNRSGNILQIDGFAGGSLAYSRGSVVVSSQTFSLPSEVHHEIQGLRHARYRLSLFAFSHCRDVVAEVSKAGGFGVLGAAGHTPESLEIELSWIDEHVDGKPYGVDLIVPTSMADKEGSLTPEQIEARFRRSTRPTWIAYWPSTASPPTACGSAGGIQLRRRHARSRRRTHSRRGLLPPHQAHRQRLGRAAEGDAGARAREGVAVGALTGAPEHAIKHAEAGVDILIVSGTEAGGHCGEISTLVLVPEVIEALKPYGDIPVLAAGGIVTGRQMAACMAMGAAGAWTGSVWLTTAEAETSPR
jgi:hypothetical protein